MEEGDTTSPLCINSDSLPHQNLGEAILDYNERTETLSQTEGLDCASALITKKAELSSDSTDALSKDKEILLTNSSIQASKKTNPVVNSSLNLKKYKKEQILQMTGDMVLSDTQRSRGYVDVFEVVINQLGFYEVINAPPGSKIYKRVDENRMETLQVGPAGFIQRLNDKSVWENVFTDKSEGATHNSTKTPAASSSKSSLKSSKPSISRSESSKSLRQELEEEVQGNADVYDDIELKKQSDLDTTLSNIDRISQLLNIVAINSFPREYSQMISQGSCAIFTPAPNESKESLANRYTGVCLRNLQCMVEFINQKNEATSPSVGSSSKASINGKPVGSGQPHPQQKIAAGQVRDGIGSAPTVETPKGGSGCIIS